MDSAGKKTAVAIHQEVARELNGILARVFTERDKTGNMDLEAVEMMLRDAMHQAGATALKELLRFAAPDANQRTERLILDEPDMCQICVWRLDSLSHRMSAFESLLKSFLTEDRDVVTGPTVGATLKSSRM